MNWTLTIVLLATLYVTLFSLYVFEANLRKPKKNVILGATIPAAHQESAEVRQITDTYIKRLRIFTLIFALLGIALLFIPYMSIQLTILLTLILFIIVGSMMIFVKANKALMHLKRSAGWQSEQKAKVAVVDIRAMEEKSKPLPRVWIAIPCVIAAIPLVFMVMELSRGIHDWTRILAYGITVIWIPVMVVLAEAFRRQNAEIVGTVSDLNVITTRIRRRAYMRMMVLAIWLLAVMSAGIWFEMGAVRPQMLFLILIGALSLVLMVYAIHAEFAVRRAQEKFTKLAGDTLEIDNDEYWIWGMFYYNRNDKRTLMNDRVGANMSVNLARPLGKIGMGLAALAILAMPLIGGWTIAQEFSPISYSVDGTVITATHVTSRRIDLGEGFEAELIYESPRGTRTAGTAIGTLRQGRFQLDGIGTAWLLLHAEDTPLILFTTAEGSRYLFNYDPVFSPLLNR